MTAIQDWCNTIRSWLAIGNEVYPDEVVTSWIRMAEEQLSKTLRCKDNLQLDTGVLTQDRYLLPADWQKLDLVRIVGGRTLRYIPRDDYYNQDQEYVDDLVNCYTLSGNYIIVGGTSNLGLEVEITYFQDIPALQDVVSWVQVKYPTLYTVQILSVASAYAIEDARAPMWAGQVTQLLQEINVGYLLSKASGSKLTQRHQRTFG